VHFAGKLVEDPELFEAMWQHLKSDGVPSEAANMITAEMFHHGTDVDSSVERFMRLWENYKSKGYEEHAAQAMAVETMEGKQKEPKESLRFARCVGEVVEGGCSPESAIMDCLNMREMLE
tara:strand:+ start:1254 stop:1613 length:360 start_codon:yes stop_codon:yes gene_type:complete